MNLEEPRIIKARTIITMNSDQPRAEAMVIEGERISYVGDLNHCSQLFPHAKVTDLGNSVLMPGFIDDHSHPLLSGMATMSPAGYIAPWVAPTWEEIETIFHDYARKTNDSLLFFGFDQLLHNKEEPNAKVLDEIFGDRKVAVMNNSGHAIYVTTAVLRELGFLSQSPDDPVGGFFGRDKEGNLTGQGYELPAVMMLLAPVMKSLGANPLYQAAQYFALMSKAGITSTSEMTFGYDMKTGYEVLCQLEYSPLRISLYHMSTDEGSEKPITFTVEENRLRKQGVKLWADGSPWLGNIAISYPYLDSAVVRRVGIKPGIPGESAMNYTLEELKAVLDKHAPLGLQMAFHVNGDLGLERVLNAYDYALKKYKLYNTDHRWRLEHVGGIRPDQLKRVADMGLTVSMSPFQFYYWGDLLDGQLFDTSVGAHWQLFRTAFDAGVSPSFHNDGSVSPPSPLLNIQTAVTRRTRSGAVRGLDQTISLEEALAAETINAAYKLFRDKDVGSLEVGKLADLVELSADPYEVPLEKIGSAIHIRGTWLGGKKVDLDRFLEETAKLDHKPHEHLKGKVKNCC